MKKITILAAVVALLGSCAQNTEDTIKPNAKVEGRTIYATFDNEEEETKTYVENYKYLRWHAGDEISFFDATTHNSQYVFAGNDGDAEGEFSAVATGEGTAIATTYGVYPYNANTTISTEGVLSVELPATQAYGVNSFGKGTNTMVAVGEGATDDKLFFKNACGYLVVKLYNESGATVKNVVLKGNNEEKIAGAATITATHTGVPSIAMADTATTAVTIDCGEGVEIGTTADTDTEFWFALPEITFEGGITITATDTEGKEYEKTTTKPVAITRNNVQPMKALGAEFKATKPANNEIWYTNGSTTEPTEPYDKTVFGATYLSNSYDAEKESWVIKFGGDVTTIGYKAFYFCRSLTSINIPNSVSSIGNYAFQTCSGLVDVSLSNNIASIGQYAFQSCALTGINLPNSITSIGDYAFIYSDIESIVIPNSVTNIGSGAFEYCRSLTQVAIPESITKIGMRMFVGCQSLTTISIPDWITAIGYQAFNSSGLESIVIPESVTSFDDYAFSNCLSLETFYCKPITPPEFGTSMFKDTSTKLKIYVPSESVTKYKNAYGWSTYKTKIEGI